MDDFATNAQRADREGAARGHIDSDDCVHLLHGLLGAREAESVLEHMASCASCEVVFRQVVADRARVRATRSLRISPIGSPYFEPVTDAPTRKPDVGAGPFARLLSLPGRFEWSPRRGIGAAALGAVALLVAVLIHGLGNRWGKDADLEWLPAYTEALQPRDSEDETNALLREGLEAYGRRDLDRCVALLGRAKVGPSRSALRDSYLASALALDRRLTQAARVCDRLDINSLPEPWRSVLFRTQSASLMGSGQEERADSLLRYLLAEPGALGAWAKVKVANRRASGRR
jgi:hypothetical protein